MILLDDKEIDKLIYPRGQGKKTVARAQLKKVVEWMTERCPHAPRNFPSDKRMCVNCMDDELLKEAGL